MSEGSSGPITFGSVENEGDVVRYPCPSCNDSQNNFEWVETMTADVFPEHDAVFETDAHTFLAINEYDENEPVRLFKCQSCGQAIGHFPESGIQYVG